MSQSMIKKGRHVTPTRKKELDSIQKLFETVMPFTPMGRKVTDNWLWDSYNKVKVVVKDSADVVMSDHEKKVAEVFNILGISKTVNALDDLHQEDDYTTRENEIAAKHFNDSDVFTENDGDMLLDNNDNNNTVVIDNSMSEVGVEVEVDVDPAEALKYLSNLKKYRVNRLCVENLKEKGWEMLGENLEEERRWAHLVKTQEQQQINAAVLYYVNNQKLCRDRRASMKNTFNTRMKWEIDKQNAIKDSNFSFTL